MIKSLPKEKLRYDCPSKDLSCKTSEEAQPVKGIIGQKRAMKALRFGLDVDSPGFNIYVSGRPGTGKLTAVKGFLRELAQQKETPRDWCYVNNFQDSYKPRCLSLPAGKANKFKNDMDSLIDEARQSLREAFESDEFAAKREEILNQFQQKRQSLFRDLNQEASQKNLVIRQTPAGIFTVPVNQEGEEMSSEEYARLSEKKQQQLDEYRTELQNKIQRTLKDARKKERNAREKLDSLQRDVALYAIEILIEELADKYEGEKDVQDYLQEVKNDILDNLEQFQVSTDNKRGKRKSGNPLNRQSGSSDDTLEAYKVNVLVDNSSCEGAPVIIEMNPTYNNLFGRVEKESQMGTLTTDYTLIREGALHKANGGYLILPVRELFQNPFSWDSLKRGIRNEQIDIEDATEKLGFLTTKSLKPESIPLNVKVILVDEPMFYHLLYRYDSDFKELFKVKADFDTSMERTDKNIDQYVSFVCKVCREENMNPLDASALSRLIEHSSRLAENKKKLSTRFGEITDIIREANYYAGHKGKAAIADRHIQKAIDEKFYRSGLLKDKIQELIKEGTLLIDIKDEKVGQVNGLSVLNLGDVTFGRPNRITASLGVGKGEVVDIEREAKLGGPIHTKGVLILSGYLTQKFGADRPVTLSARLVFEQSYSEIEGDSASSAELYTLLSSLSGYPVKQGIAVTGSVNQKGEVQAIGGVNQKVEGFFEVCKAKGLTGEQGVIIPAANVKNLMVKREVVEAVEKEKFNIWAASTVDEGIEILTGRKAGKRKKDGTFEKNTVHGKVMQRLQKMTEQMQKFSAWGGSNNKQEKKVKRKDK